VARRFALYLTKLTLDKMDASCPERTAKENWAEYKALVAQAVAGMQDNLEASRKEIVLALGDILSQIIRVQNKRQYGETLIQVITICKSEKERKHKKCCTLIEKVKRY
jgi:hypothetical protein